MNNDIEHLRETIKISLASRAAGNHPFGSLLVGPDGEILIRCGNMHAADKGVGNAEMNVAWEALRYEPEFLARCTLVIPVEPCCMCSGGAYWAGIGTVVYGLTERRLVELTGDNPENLTMDMPCREVFDAGVEVRGYIPNSKPRSSLRTKIFGDERMAERAGLLKAE